VFTTEVLEGNPSPCLDQEVEGWDESKLEYSTTNIVCDQSRSTSRGRFPSMNTIHNGMGRGGNEHGDTQQDEPVGGQCEGLHTGAHMDSNIESMDLL
jgi:hypothetical protein